MSEHILSNLEKGVFTVMLNRPKKKNAITKAMYVRLTEIFEAASANPEVNVVIIRGEHDFSAGYDLQSVLENPPQDVNAPVFRFMLALSKCPLPVVAAVDGVAVGLGATLLLHCDFVFATSESIFRLPFVNIGGVPEFAVSLLLPLRAGYLRAAELLMLCEEFDAYTAKQSGFVTQVCERSELDNTVRSCVERLLSKPRKALIEAKSLLRRDIEPVEERIYREARMFVNGIASPEGREAFQSLVKK